MVHRKKIELKDVKNLELENNPMNGVIEYYYMIYNDIYEEFWGKYDWDDKDYKWFENKYDQYMDKFNTYKKDVIDDIKRKEKQLKTVKKEIKEWNTHLKSEKKKKEKGK